MTWQIWSVLPVWAVSLAAAIVIGVASPTGTRLTWLAIALAAAVVLTFAIQLATQRSVGFVTRAMASIGVSVVILAVATGVLAILG